MTRHIRQLVTPAPDREAGGSFCTWSRWSLAWGFLQSRTSGQHLSNPRPSLRCSPSPLHGEGLGRRRRIRISQLCWVEANDGKRNGLSSSQQLTLKLKEYYIQHDELMSIEVHFRISSIYLWSILTVYLQFISKPAGGRWRRMPHQTVQLLAIHGPQGVQGVVRGDHPVVRWAIGGLAIQVRLPGEAGGRSGHRATQSSLSVGLTLHQNYRFQGGDGDGWRREF